MDFLYDGPVDASATILLGHGAGGAMDSAAMTAAARALAAAGLRVARFEFGYMAERLDVIPAQVQVLVTRRPRYACRRCAQACFGMQF